MLHYYNKDTCTLTIPQYFDSPLVDLPEDTKIIIFEENNNKGEYSIFNQPINKGSLPNSITHLTFGWKFNQQINEGSLPDSITHLTFGGNFYQPVNKLPKSLTHLTFGCNFNQSVENLQDSLEYLSFWTNNPINNIPLSVSIVKINFYEDDEFNSNIDNLPSSINKIIVNDIRKIDYIKKIPFGCEVVEEEEDYFL